MFFSPTKSLLLVCLAVLSLGQLIPLDSNTIEQVFKHKKGGFLLLLGNEQAESLAFGSFARFVLGNHLQVITAISRREDGTGLFKQVAKELGVEADETPHLIFITQEGKKYKFDNEQQYNPDNIELFFHKAAQGQLPPFIKSQPRPSAANGYVATLVSADFQEFVLNTQREVLVKFYAPWCHHCRVMAAEYQKTARLLSGNPNILIAEIDASANEVPSVSIQGFPTIKWWGKDKSKPSIEFHGARTAENFIGFLKQHTEYAWVAVESERRPDKEERRPDKEEDRSEWEL